MSNSGWNGTSTGGIRLWWLTLRLRQDLQFMASRGSTVARRGVKRSILTCGRDIAR